LHLLRLFSDKLSNGDFPGKRDRNFCREFEIPGKSESKIPEESGSNITGDWYQGFLGASKSRIPVDPWALGSRIPWGTKIVDS
jgi:hypothetical protein